MPRHSPPYLLCSPPHAPCLLLLLQLEPELMVDLVWHTHMQWPLRYRRDCMCLAGQFIDHNDDVGRSALNKNGVLQ